MLLVVVKVAAGENVLLYTHQAGFLHHVSPPPDLRQPKIVQDMFRGIVTHTFVMVVGGNLNLCECWRA